MGNPLPYWRGDIVYHCQKTPELLGQAQELIEIAPADLQAGDWIGLSGCYDLAHAATCHDTAVIHACHLNHPGRLWPVIAAGYLVEVAIADATVRRLRSQIKEAWRMAKVSTAVETECYGVNPPRDALGRGRGSGRRGGVRTVAVRRKRKGGKVWIGEQHMLQWEADGVKHSRYLRKAIAPQVRADWEAGATVKELLEKYKLVEPKHGI